MRAVCKTCGWDVSEGDLRAENIDSSGEGALGVWQLAAHHEYYFDPYDWPKSATGPVVVHLVVLEPSGLTVDGYGRAIGVAQWN
jgi:hypothetical protein